MIGAFACFAFPNQRFVITLSSTLSSSLAVESKENPGDSELLRLSCAVLALCISSLH